MRALDEERLEFLIALLSSGNWVSGRVIQSSFHHRFGDPIYKPEMDVLRDEFRVEFENHLEGPRGRTNHYFYRLRIPAGGD